MNNIEKLQDLIGYWFNDVSLLKEALTHSSYANENNTRSYERLEFLGDAVIELIVSDYIYNHLNFGAGDLTKLRASLVSTDYFKNIVCEIGLDKMAYKSKSLQQLSKKNIADLLESLLGAIYVDGGYDNAKKLVYKYIIKGEDNIGFVLKNSIDYKTVLQELCQANTDKFEYKVLSSSGLDHEKVFEVGLYINEELVCAAKDRSIQLAEENCAQVYLKNIKNK